MKRISLAFLSVIFCVSLNAQVTFGVKAGLNLANLNATSYPGVSYKFKADFHAGAFVRVPLAGKLSLQPEVLYSGQGSTVKSDEYKANYNLGFINVPVLAAYAITDGLQVETGPQLGLLLSAKVKEDGHSTDVKDELNTVDFGWAFGVSYLLPANFGFDVRYNLGLSNLAKDSGDGHIKNSVIQAGVFYRFGKK